MLRREFLKLLGFGLPALILVRPEIKLEKPKSKPIKEVSIPSVWTGTNGTTGTVTWANTIANGDKTVYYVHPWPEYDYNWDAVTLSPEAKDG